MAGTAMCEARVETGNDGKARDATPCTADRCPTRLSRSQPVVGDGHHPATADGERERGAGAGGGEGRRGPDAGGPAPAAPLTGALGVICCGVVASVFGESGDSAAGGTANTRAGAEG